MPERAAAVQSFAKINVDLRVLHRRPDNYHELRTIFQTVSLADTIRIRYAPARRTRLAVEGNVDIPDNLILRAAEAVLEASRTPAEVTFQLEKKIPMGAGLGGGSSNAAAVLLALPALAGVNIPMSRLAAMGAALGSDVPFFLYGGTALGIGRGTELFPIGDLPARHAVVVATGIHVSTAEAYRDLNRRSMTDSLPSAGETLTSAVSGADTEGFHRLVWLLAGRRPARDWNVLCVNDFETVVFGRHPALRSWKNRLRKAGASPAMMTGSGSALFGLFDTADAAETARAALDRGSKARVIRMTLLTGARYRGAWRRFLAQHIVSDPQWPPHSRYSKQ